MGELSQGYLRRKGRTNGATIGVGLVGEVISTVLPSGSALTLTSGDFIKVAEITLPNGIWVLSGYGGFRPSAGATISDYGVWQNNANAPVLASIGSRVLLPAATVCSANQDLGLTMKTAFLNRNTGDVVLAVWVRAVFTGTVKGFGGIYAHRLATA